MNLFYAPDAAPGLTVLGEEESLHCARVLRMKTGERLLVTNGKGMLFEARVEEPHPKHTSIICDEGIRIPGTPDDLVHIALAPTKNIERTEWFIEKATEIGIGTISLFFSAHSERRTVKPDRLRRTAIAAMKQSMKATLPEIVVYENMHDFLESVAVEQRFIAWIDASVSQTLAETVVPGRGTVVMIGPEGDFTRAEVNLAIDRGFVPVSLGKSRLRTETAALVACHTIQLLNQLKKL
ncbi:MAG: 16S rRNA (uracil(1498)-N(3))-methyltransferase [Bacteroidetes bacterium]|nr:16S rRNA (uracil(1498)-N(3))-methyltransferase [Bacteroidota bacterium]